MAVSDCPALHYSVDEELLMEIKHGIVLSEDQLRGRLKRLGLKRRGSESSLEEVKATIQVNKN